MEETGAADGDNAPPSTASDDGDGSDHHASGLAQPPTHTTGEGSSLRKKTTGNLAQDDHGFARHDDSDGESGDHSPDFSMDSVFLRLLPIRVECHKGGIVMGNNNTHTILVGKFRDADGIISATPVLFILIIQR